MVEPVELDEELSPADAVLLMGSAPERISDLVFGLDGAARMRVIGQPNAIIDAKDCQLLAGPRQGRVLVVRRRTPAQA